MNCYFDSNNSNHNNRSLINILSLWCWGLHSNHAIVTSQLLLYMWRATPFSIYFARIACMIWFIISTSLTYQLERSMIQFQLASCVPLCSFSSRFKSDSAVAFLFFVGKTWKAARVSDLNRDCAHSWLWLTLLTQCPEFFSVKGFTNTNYTSGAPNTFRYLCVDSVTIFVNVLIP